MSKGRHSFRQSDLTKAIKAVTRAGLSIARVVVEPGGEIVVYPGSPTQNVPVEVNENEWDTVQ